MINYMMKFLKVKKVPPKTSAEIQLQKITDILFPSPVTEVDKTGTKFMVDSSADINLLAALTDLQEGYNDEISQGTIKSVSDRLYEVRQMLEIEATLDTDAKYVVVDDREKE